MSEVNYDRSMSVDELLGEMSARKERMLEKMLGVDRSVVDDIAVDQHCLTCIGKGVKTLIPNWIARSHQCCYSCANIGRLVDLDDYVVDTSFPIVYGKQKGSKLIVKETPAKEKYHISDTLNIFSPELQELWKTYYNRFVINSVGFFECCPKEKENANNMTFYHIPSFLNDLLIGYYIEKRFASLTNTVYDGFVCGNNSYKLSKELSQDYDIGKVDVKTLKGLMFQLMNNLRYFAYFHFTHGQPILSNLQLVKNKITYNVSGGKTFSFDMQLILRNFYHSSITVDNNRYGNMSDHSLIYVEQYYESNTFSKNMIFNHVGINGVYYLYFTDTNRELLYHLIQMCLPLYSGMFDFYCFMTSLMCQKEIYETLTQDPKMLKWWTDFFLPGEYPTVIWKIQQEWNNPEPVSMPKLLYIFQNIHLRCDILPFRHSNFPSFT